MDKRSRKIVMYFDEITRKDLPLVGGKCANLGEMSTAVNVPVPYGFATTAYAYQLFMKENKLWPKIEKELKKIKDPNDTKILKEVGKKARSLIMNAKMPKKISDEVKKADRSTGEGRVSVRSSATAEDLPGASFAGQQETYLNIQGEEDVVKKVQECYSSLFTDRAIFYRIEKGFDHEAVALSAAVQKMIDSVCSGVMFTLDVRNGDTSKIVIEGSWGLGEYIVLGKVTPDDFFVRKSDLHIVEKKISEKKIMLINKPGRGVIEKQVEKSKQNEPVLEEYEIRKLARFALELEKHYKCAQDIEWAKHTDGHLYILQTRPETAWAGREKAVELEKVRGEVLLKGLPASPGMGSGRAIIVRSMDDIGKVQNKDVLVTPMTSPDMVPAMKKASAIVTDSGGMTSHAAIVSRELGIPCVVGSGDATKKIKPGEMITIDGNTGLVYRGVVAAAHEKEFEGPLPKTRTKIYANMSVPEIADKIAKKAFDGVGLLREEFIVATYIKEHPLSLIERGKEKFFVDKLAEGVETVAKAFSPRPVILRLSDFKTNEYREMKGGKAYEPHEENPMIGWRGCSRYISPEYEKAFRLELKAVRQVRKKYKNLWIMLPFVRNIHEVQLIEKIMKEEGLERNKDMKLFLMAEVPSNIFLADQFSQYCDGFSIGSNDLTQLILGVDRDSEKLGKMGEFDERNAAVKRAIVHLIKIAHAHGRTVGICGQAPSVYPEFARFLVHNKIDSISINPDVFEKTKFIVHDAERKG
ncbi:MAG: phosphoenolpyruvate synthase [Candidatus Micrarchaeota archaeon]